jgi:hypothetical protein
MDRVFGRPEERSEEDRPGDRSRVAPEDEQAIERYRYLLRTAPPEALEEAHAEAFARLTPEQRSEVLRRFGESLPSSELGEARSGDPRAMARTATRAEVRDPGFLERTLGRGGMGMGGVGGVFGPSLLGSLAGTFLGTAIASQFLHGFGGPTPEGLSADEPGGAADQEYSEADLDQGSDLDGGGFDDIEV